MSYQQDSNPAHSEDTLEDVLKGLCRWAALASSPEQAVQFTDFTTATHFINQNYISKDRVIKAIGEDEDELLSTVVVERAPISRNQLRAEIRKELNL